MSASKITHGALGLGTSPECVDIDSFSCWVCGALSQRGMPIHAWMGSNFTGQNRARSPSSSHVCESCVLVMAGRPPDTLRMYTVLCDDRGALKLTKGDKPAIRSWLREPHHGPWFAAVADSGQKHIIPWAPVNVSDRSPLVAFEETTVQIGDWSLVDEATELLTLGATKEELASGQLGPRAWANCGARLREFERRFGSLRGGGWFELGVWLAQRDEDRVKERMEKENAERKRKREAANADRRDAARAARRVPRDKPLQCAQALGPDPGPDADRGTNDVECGGVGDERAAGAPAQLTFAAALGLDHDAGKRGA